MIHADDARPSYTVLLSTYLSYILLIIIGHIRDFFGKKFTPASYAHLMPQNVSPCLVYVANMYRATPRSTLTSTLSTPVD